MRVVITLYSLMAHGLSFKEMAKADAMCSEKVKKALDINSIYDEDLRKGLSSLQKERKSLLQSLTKKKLDFLQKCKLPSIHRAQSEPENAAMQKKVADFCFGSSNNRLSQRSAGSPVPVQARPRSQPSSNEMSKFNHRQKSILSEKDFTLEECDTLAQEDNRLLNAEQGTTKQTERNDFMMSSPGVSLPPPRSPLLSRLASPEMNELVQSRSLPSSPRAPRRRAFTLDTSMSFGSCSNLKIALERSHSTPPTKQSMRCRAESSPIDLEVSLFC